MSTKTKKPAAKKSTRKPAAKPAVKPAKPAAKSKAVRKPAAKSKPVKSAYGDLPQALPRVDKLFVPNVSKDGKILKTFAEYTVEGKTADIMLVLLAADGPITKGYAPENKLLDKGPSGDGGLLDLIRRLPHNVGVRVSQKDLNKLSNERSALANIGRQDGLENCILVQERYEDPKTGESKIRFPRVEGSSALYRELTARGKACKVELSKRSLNQTS